jgi:hypothetical protein
MKACLKKTLLSISITCLLYSVSGADSKTETPQKDEAPVADSKSPIVPKESEKAVAPEAKDAPEKTEKVPAYRKNILSEIEELLVKIEEHDSRQTLSLADKKQREKLLKCFINSFHAGMEYIPASEKLNEKATPEVSDKVFGTIIVDKNQVVYARIDNFADKTLLKLKEDLESISRLARQPLGLIVDARNCRGKAYANALKAASMLVNHKFLPETKAVSLGKRLFELPIIVLVGSKTAGAGEVFTSLISSSPSVIVAGNSTCGRPFEKKVIKLKDGGRLLIPFDPDYLDTISKEKIIPGLKISNGKQADYEDISQNTDKAKEDKCLTRSQDILISVQKLKNKKLKNPGSK